MESVATVQFIKRAQELGFSLEDVESLLHLANGGPEACEAAHRMATGKIAELDRKIASRDAMRRSLRQLAATCERPRSERDCPVIESLAGEDAG